MKPVLGHHKLGWRLISSEKIRKNFPKLFWLYSGSAGAILYGFIVLYFVSQTLSVSEYGVFVSVTSVSSLLFNVAGVRASEALAYFVARKNSPVGNRVYFAWAVIFDLLVVVFLISLVRGVGAYAPGLLGVDWQLVSLGLIGASAVYLRGAVQGYLVGRDKQELNGAINSLDQTIKITLVLWGVGGGALSVSFVLLVQAISAFVCLVVSLLVYELVNSDPKSSVVQLLNKKEALRYLQFTFKVFISTLFKGGNKYLDVLILTALAQPHYVGVYGVLKKILSPVRFISSPFAQIFLPRFVCGIEASRYESVAGVITKSCILLFVVSVGYAVLAAFILILWDLELESPLYFIPVAIAVTLQIMLWWTRPLAIAIDPMLSIYSSILATVSMMTFCIVGTFLFGLWGFLLGNLLKVVVVALYWWWVFDQQVANRTSYRESGKC